MKIFEKKCIHEFVKGDPLIISGYGLTEYEIFPCKKCGMLTWILTKDIEDLFPKLKGRLFT